MPISHKRCLGCGKIKFISEFCVNRDRKGHYQRRCKVCSREKVKVIPSIVEKRRIVELAKNRPCVDCGQAYPLCVMDFDHRDPFQKVFNLSQYIHWSLEEVKAEIVKCDVVCSNCHRIRTWLGGRWTQERITTRTSPTDD